MSVPAVSPNSSTARQRAGHATRTAPALLALLSAAAILIISYWYLYVHKYDHLTLLYLLLLYGLFLPALLWYWRASRTRYPSPTRIRPTYLLTVVAFSALAITVGKSTEFGRLISDCSAYRFQARLFAAGKLKAAAMPGAQTDIRETPDDIFFVHTLQTPGGWYAKYPPAWPLLLAGGYLLHCVWLINPLMGIIQLLLLWSLSRPLGRPTQMLAVVIASTSAYMLISNVGYMAHPFEAVICLLAVSCLWKGVSKGQLLWIVICFLLVVLGTQIRLYTGAVLGLLCAGILVWELKTRRELLIPALGVAVTAGLLAIGLYFGENKLYTGDALLSPYSLYRGGNGVDEFTLNPIRIFRGMHIWRSALTETARVTFPFIPLLAVYACVKERAYRSYLIYMALLFPLLVMAYTADPAPSGSFDGERFYFEGFGLLAIVAAHGLCLFVKNWGIGSRSVNVTIAVLIAIQTPIIISTIDDIEGTLRPYLQAHRLAQSAPTVPLVFLRTYPSKFASKQINWNDANWPEAPTVFLTDPGTQRRESVACQFGRSPYRLIEFDPQKNQMIKSDRSAHCSSRANEGSPSIRGAF